MESDKGSLPSPNISNLRASSNTTIPVSATFWGSVCPTLAPSISYSGLPDTTSHVSHSPLLGPDVYPTVWQVLACRPGCGRLLIEAQWPGVGGEEGAGGSEGQGQGGGGGQMGRQVAL